MGDAKILGHSTMIRMMKREPCLFVKVQTRKGSRKREVGVSSTMTNAIFFVVMNRQPRFFVKLSSGKESLKKVSGAMTAQKDLDLGLKIYDLIINQSHI